MQRRARPFSGPEAAEILTLQSQAQCLPAALSADWCRNSQKQGLHQHLHQAFSPEICTNFCTTGELHP
jgi:hypothetical protein